MGPFLYDVVSLLGDSYVNLGEKLRKELLSYYHDVHPGYSADGADQLMYEYALIGLQRHLKHLGTFGYVTLSGLENCLHHVDLTLRYIRSHLTYFPEYSEACKLLEDLFTSAETAIEAWN